MSASPESFSRIRRKAGSVTPPRPGSGRSGGSRRSRRCSRPARCAAPRSSCYSCLSSFTCFWSSSTTSSSHLFEPALDDLLLDVLGLALGGGLLAQHAQLGLLRPRRPPRPRETYSGFDGGHVQRHLAGELLELVGAGHEVGLAVDLDQRADLAAGVDVARHDALGRRRARRAWRPRPGPSRAGSRWPCRRRRRASWSAALASMIPAPVRSRRLFTSWAEMVMLIRTPRQGRTCGARAAPGARGGLGPRAARGCGLVGREAGLLRLAAGALLGLAALLLLGLALAPSPRPRGAPAPRARAGRPPPRRGSAGRCRAPRRRCRR